MANTEREERRGIKLEVDTHERLKKYAAKHGISQTGLLRYISYILSGRDEFGTIDMDMDKLKDMAPTNTQQSKSRWDELVSKFTETVGDYDEVDSRDLAKAMGYSTAQVRRHISNLCGEGKVTRKGNRLIFKGTTITFCVNEWSKLGKLPPRKVSRKRLKKAT